MVGMAAHFTKERPLPDEAAAGTFKGATKGTAMGNEDPEHAQGFRNILVTEACHDYIPHWWPHGHIIGYEHEFIHGVVDFLNAIESDTPIEPNFYDGMKCTEVMEAGLKSSETGQRIDLK